eukprot:scaffold13865_cov71-Phaeocystis_antarctica.AAC.1
MLPLSTPRLVLAHADATFGFPEVRRGVLPGVVSVAARRRLSVATCDRAFCTGDSFDASTALRLGLVDFVGSWEQIEAELTQIIERCAAVGFEWLERCCGTLVPPPPPPPPLELAPPPEWLTTNDGASVVRIGTAGCGACAALLHRVCRGLAALKAAAAPSLRVVLLSVGTEEADSEDGQSHKEVSTEEEAQLEAAMAALTERGVAVVCALAGTVRGVALLVSLAAHYRIVGTGTTLLSGGARCARQVQATLRADDAAAFARKGRADADEAVGLGLASEMAEDAEERARQFAHWLLLQPATGMRHVLRLTFRSDDDPISPAAAGAYARKVGAILLECDSGVEAARAALERLRDARDAGPPWLSAAGPVGSEAASVGAAAAAARLQLACGLVEAALTSKPVALPSVPDACASRDAGIHALEVYTPRRARLAEMGTLMAVVPHPPGPLAWPPNKLPSLQRPQRKRPQIDLFVLSTHRHAVDAAELEAAHGVPGKYTEGLMMREWSACDEDEDVVTMALTAVRQLVERCAVRWEDIGMLQVGFTWHAITVFASTAYVLRTQWTCCTAHATQPQVGSESLLDRSKSIKSHLMALFPPGCANVEGVDAYQACYGGTAALLACTNWVGSE